MNRLCTVLFAVVLTAVCSSNCNNIWIEWIEPTTKMAFVRLPAGSFTMGSPADEAGREAQEVQHHVTISRAFWMGQSEVTQAEWLSVMGSNPSTFSTASGDYPVEQVTWHDVHAFLDKLHQRSPGYTFRLPTEAEWEYACRAGTTTAYSTGATLTHAQANFSDAATSTAAASWGRTLSARVFPPNPWGLYGMHGNVWEWTEDEWCPYSSGPETDPHASCGSALKVIRGGSWVFGADSARCALRYTHRPEDRGYSIGFRVVRE